MSRPFVVIIDCRYDSDADPIPIAIPTPTDPDPDPDPDDVNLLERSRALYTAAAGVPLTLDRDDLLQGMHHLHQVRLVGHDAVDVLVGAGDLIEHPLVLAALDSLGLLLQVLSG